MSAGVLPCSSLRSLWYMASRVVSTAGYGQIDIRPEGWNSTTDLKQIKIYWRLHRVQCYILSRLFFYSNIFFPIQEHPSVFAYEHNPQWQMLYLNGLAGPNSSSSITRSLPIRSSRTQRTDIRILGESGRYPARTKRQRRSYMQLPRDVKMQHRS